MNTDLTNKKSNDKDIDFDKYLIDLSKEIPYGERQKKTRETISGVLDQYIELIHDETVDIEETITELMIELHDLIKVEQL